MVDCFGNVLERRAIQGEMQSRLPHTISMFSKELDRVKLMYDEQIKAKDTAYDRYVPVSRYDFFCVNKSSYT